MDGPSRMIAEEIAADLPIAEAIYYRGSASNKYIGCGVREKQSARYHATLNAAVIGSEPSSRFLNFPAHAYNFPFDLMVMGQHFAIFDTNFTLQPGLPSLVSAGEPDFLDAGLTKQE
jgi:hypothetical protein